MVITHRIAGITFRTESDVLIPHLLGDPFDRFRVSDGAPEARFRVRQFDPDAMTLPPLRDEEQERIVRSVGFPKQWLDKPILRSPEVRAKLRACLDRPELVQVDLRWNRAIIRNYATSDLDLLYPPNRRADFAEPIFVAGYRNLLGCLLPNFSALSIHGSGVIRNCTAAVFLAPDEGGKTSVVEHLPIESILNDDHLILRQDGKIITVHGAPFGPITCGPRQARLGGFFLLEKAPHFELIPIRAWDVLEFLWNEHMHMWCVMPKHLRVRAYEILAAACRQAVAYRMRFPKNYIDWNAIDVAMMR